MPRGEMIALGLLGFELREAQGYSLGRNNKKSMLNFYNDFILKVKFWRNNEYKILLKIINVEVSLEKRV